MRPPTRQGPLGPVGAKGQPGPADAKQPRNSVDAAVPPLRSGASRGYELTVVAPTFQERANVAAFVQRLREALGAVSWQVIFVDDASPDGTAEAVKALAAEDPRISCLRRVGRRGLAGAVMEGALASAAPFVLVMDADGQHDADLIPAMLMRLRGGQSDLVVASRYLEGASADEGLGGVRLWGSQLANRMASRVSGGALTDPMSGFFMARRAVFDAAAGRVEPSGFKVLFDLVASSRGRLRVEELPLRFRPRLDGASKLDRRIVLDYLGLLAARTSHDVISPRALVFALVGTSGVAVHLLAMRALLSWTGLGFARADLLAAFVAMSSNYLLNNEITYRDRRRRGWLLASGFPRFAALCSIGLLMNVAVAVEVKGLTHLWWLGGLSGAAVAAAWNYATTTLALW